MIDTVRFRIPEPMTPKLLKSWSYSCKPHEGGAWYAFHTKLDGPFGSVVNLKYYPQDPKMDKNPLILIELSLPKFLYGNNVTMLYEPELVLKQLEVFLHDPLDRSVNLAKSELDRIDLCYNHFVGDYVDAYIKYLFTVSHPTKKTKPYYPSFGVQFYSRDNTLSFYGKFDESGLILALGILREELSLVNKRSVRRVLGNGNKPAFITDFTPEVVEKILQKENAKLGVNDVVIANENLALKVLIGKYGSEQGMRLYGYVCALEKNDNKELISYGISKQTLSRNRAAVLEANLASQLHNQVEVLQNLTINLKKVSWIEEFV